MTRTQERIVAATAGLCLVTAAVCFAAMIFGGTQ